MGVHGPSRRPPQRRRPQYCHNPRLRYRIATRADDSGRRYPRLGKLHWSPEGSGHEANRDGAASIWGAVFDRLAALLTACSEGIEPGMEAVHLRRIIAIRCEVLELLGIVGKIVELSLSGHVLDVRAIPGAQRKKRR